MNEGAFLKEPFLGIGSVGQAVQAIQENISLPRPLQNRGIKPRDLLLGSPQTLLRVGMGEQISGQPCPLGTTGGGEHGEHVHERLRGIADPVHIAKAEGVRLPLIVAAVFQK